MKIKTWPEGLDVRGLGDNWEMLGVRKQLMTKKRGRKWAKQ